jgi:hypothetical protein
VPGDIANSVIITLERKRCSSLPASPVALAHVVGVPLQQLHACPAAVMLSHACAPPLLAACCEATLLSNMNVSKELHGHENLCAAAAVDSSPQRVRGEALKRADMIFTLLCRHQTKETDIDNHTILSVREEARSIRKPNRA